MQWRLLLESLTQFYLCEIAFCFSYPHLITSLAIS
nr:MAG TPA_asm: hypothetical protein [Caudoviricetes sp.]